MKKEKSLSQKITHVLGVYIKTQFVLIIAVTLIAWAMLSLLGVQHALLLGVVTGSASIVPVLGIVITAFITAIVAIFDNIHFLPTIHPIVEGLIVVVLYGVLNIVVDYLLAPYIIGKSTNVHPLVLLAAVLVGSITLGFFGALLAVPAVLVIKTIIEDNHKK